MPRVAKRLTLAEAAEKVGVTPDSLRQAIHRGTLKARRQQHLWTVSEADLEAYVANRWQNSPRRPEWWQRRREQQAEQE
jgi:excisionase family DNA binding protein